MATSMLLYFAPQLLRTTGFLIALVLFSLALGIWMTGGQKRSSSRLRWLVAVVVYALAGVYAVLWTNLPGLRTTPTGSAIAAFLLVAQPAWATGALLASISKDMGAAVAALSGAALGAVLRVALVPGVDGDVIFFSAATAILIAGVWYEGSAAFSQLIQRPMNRKTVLVTGV